MQRRFHGLAGVAGALICGLAALGWRLMAPPPYAASALIAVEPDAATAPASDIAALRALAANDAVLRQAALAPEAAASIAREARPERFESVLDLISPRLDQTDTLTRAADMLAARTLVETGEEPRSLRVTLRMEEAASAAQAANAVARAIVAAHNAAISRLDRRLDRARSDAIARADRRREAARERLASLQAADTTPTGSVMGNAPADAAAQALAEAERSAVTAEARRAQATRIYGPRHPEMMQAETQARRAAAALQAARMRAAKAPAAPRRPLAEGGPDPRAAELAATQEEAARAEVEYDGQAAQAAAPKHEARIVAAAAAPRSADRASTPLTVATSALLGFLLFGAAPGVGARMQRTRRPKFGRPHAILRRGALDPASARLVVEALDIAASTHARRILVAGESRRLQQDCAHALAAAAAQQGWRPLLIDAAGQGSGPAHDIFSLNGRTYRTRTIGAGADALAIAHPAPPPRHAAPDADRAFDLVLFDETARIDRIEIAVWIGAAAPDDRLVQSRETILWISPA